MFDFLGTLAEVRVAGEEVVPGVEDGDDGFAFVFLLVDAELLVAGAMAEGTEIIGAEEAVRAELIGCEATHDVAGDWRKWRERERVESFNIERPTLNFERAWLRPASRECRVPSEK